jgi:hypothetical protein
MNRVSAEGTSYTLYLPHSFSDSSKNSILIFLDPHGKGSLPLEKYKGLADRFNVVLMGSNDSKNGMSMEGGVDIVQKLMNECKQLPFYNGNVSLAGFSGGAKVALLGGNSVLKFNSVIYCGAALPPQSIKLTTTLLGFAGKKDMNYTEVKNFSRWAESQVKINGIVEWPGKHEWPDSAYFQHAFYWHSLNGTIDKFNPLVRQYNNFVEDVVSKEPDPLRKVEYLNNRNSVLERFMSIIEYKHQVGKILLSDAYVRAKTKETMIIANEDIRKQELISSFTSRDIGWWSGQVRQLSADKNNESNQRLLGYISLAAWTYSSNAVEQNNIPLAMRALQIYQMADPRNSEHEFLKACLYAKNNSPDSAIYFLEEAARLGLDDRSKIENEKDLATLHGRNEYQNVLSSMQISR